ncbi:DinB family protein [Peribacillus frigoritolerans]
MILDLRGEPEMDTVTGILYSMVDGNSLDVLIHDYDDVISMIKSLCHQLTDKQLNQTVEYENGNEGTIKWGIWHIADHNRYHQAHISQLRKWFSQI